MWITKDKFGFVKLWNNKPRKLDNDTFQVKDEIGIIVNDIKELSDLISYKNSPKQIFVTYIDKILYDDDDDDIFNY